jgi:peptidoglycan/LPS O-acetylase OafA/YrhL
MRGKGEPARIASLDGLRAVSIALVLMAHLAGTRGFPARLSVFMHFAELGVRIFFVISGYLISTLLFEDLRRIEAGTLTRVGALKQFYIRRVYRIFPAAYAFVLVVAALAAAGVLRLLPGDLVAAATYTTNFHQPRAWWLGHLWSLSVEEQFYVLWPAVVLATGARKALWVAAAALAVAPATRALIWVAWPDLRAYVGEAFPTIFDAIGAGCLLAGARTWLGGRAGYLRFIASPAFLLIPIAILGAALLSSHPRADLVLGQGIQNIAIAVLIDRSIRLPDSAWGRFLNRRPLVMVGALSYSLYLWQQLFVSRHAGGWINAFPVNVGLALLAAFVSYHLIERPFLRLRSRRAASRAARGAAAATAAAAAASAQAPAAR